MKSGAKLKQGDRVKVVKPPINLFYGDTKKANRFLKEYGRLIFIIDQPYNIIGTAWIKKHPRIKDRKICGHTGMIYISADYLKVLK